MSPVVLSRRFEKALLYAIHVHAPQTRKGTDTPYITHLLSVAALVLEHGGDEDTAIAGLLHDAPEDQGGEVRLAEIRDYFGERMEAITRSCSDALPVVGVEKPPWKARKAAYLRHLEDADSDVLLVSAADKLHNARAILVDYRELGEDLWARFKGGREGTLWYYREVVDVLGRRLPGALTRELADTVTRLEGLAARAGRSTSPTESEGND